MSQPDYCIVYIDGSNKIVWEKSSGSPTPGNYTKCEFKDGNPYPKIGNTSEYCYVFNNCGRGPIGQNRFCMWNDKTQKSIKPDYNGQYCP